MTSFTPQKYPAGYQSLTEKQKTAILLSLILIFSLVMRLWKINYQSLWLDELHTMNESDPDIRWSDMFYYLKCCDQHPPLYFVLSRISFELFGHTALSARLISAAAGTISVWAIFLLGKEILNKNLGLISAALTIVNYYNIYYSQEARGYILAFLFATFSFLFFIRLLKNKTLKNSILYAVFTLLLLFSHYYSLFVLASQIVLMILFFFFTETSKKKAFILYFLLSGLIIAIGYLPWLPYLQAMANIRSFWIQSISGTPLSDYFFEYFGRSSLLKHLLVILLLGYLLKVFYSGKRLVSDPAKSNPLWFSFIIFSGWILVTCLIPYIRSLLVVPMLLPRYTIVVLPAVLVMLAYGIELINFKRVKVIILTIYILFSLISLVISKKYYTAVSKSQFREMTHFVVANNSANYPIINEVVSWQQQYYFKAFNFKPNMLDGPKSIVVDSILAGKSAKYKVNGFWMVGAHGDKPFGPEQRKSLDTAFVMAMERKFFDAWAQLYVRKNIAAYN